MFGATYIPLDDELKQYHTDDIEAGRQVFIINLGEHPIHTSEGVKEILLEWSFTNHVSLSLYLRNPEGDGDATIFIVIDSNESLHLSSFLTLDGLFGQESRLIMMEWEEWQRAHAMYLDDNMECGTFTHVCSDVTEKIVSCE